MDAQIVGHKRQIELLTKALAAGKLAHAYVFAGPEGVGKKLVAERLTSALLETTPLSATPTSPLIGEKKFHPDLLEIDGREGIKIEQVRELSYKLSLKPYQAKNKVALIDSAENLTTEAANALLKVLEEPKSYTYIFLITSNPNRLPKTILSRCQKITFGPVDLPKQENEVTLQADSFFQIFASENLADRLIAAYEIADLETDEIKKILDLWLDKLQIKLHQHASKHVARQASQVMLIRKLVDQNVNSKLLLTNLMLSTS